MSLLIFAILVIIVVCFLIAIIRAIPGIAAPMNWILEVMVLLVGLIWIVSRAGLLHG